MLSVLILLWLILNAIIFMIGGPKLTGKLNKWLWQFIQSLLKNIWKFIKGIFGNFYKSSPELFWTIVFVIIIIICLVKLF